MLLKQLISIALFFISNILIGAAIEESPDQEKVDLMVLEEFHNIVKEYWGRQQDFNNGDEKTKLKILQTGIWYSADYFRALEKLSGNASCKTRLDWFVKGDRFITGFVYGSTALIGLAADRKIMLKDGVKASEAIANIGVKELVFIDCLMAVELATYRALIKHLGKDKFDKIFSADARRSDSFNDRALLSVAIQETRLDYFLEYMPFDVNEEFSRRGQDYYIPNNYLYLLKHPFDIGAGFHVMLLRHEAGEDAFVIGFGLDPKGVTKKFVQSLLVDLFNDEPVHSHMVTEKALAARGQVAKIGRAALRDKKIEGTASSCADELLTALLEIYQETLELSSEAVNISILPYVKDYDVEDPSKNLGIPRLRVRQLECLLKLYAHQFE